MGLWWLLAAVPVTVLTVAFALVANDWIAWKPPVLVAGACALTFLSLIVMALLWVKVFA